MDYTNHLLPVRKSSIITNATGTITGASARIVALEDSIITITWNDTTTTVLDLKAFTGVDLKETLSFSYIVSSGSVVKV